VLTGAAAPQARMGVEKLACSYASAALVQLQWQGRPEGVKLDDLLDAHGCIAVPSSQCPTSHANCT